MGIAEKVLKVRGQRSRSYCTMWTL